MAYFTLDATAGGSAANTYIATVAEARSIAATLAAMPSVGASFTALNAASDDVLNDALVLAANAVDTQSYPGYKKTAAQARAWPRVGTRMAEAENSLPVGLKFAQVTEAASLLSAQSEAALSAAAGVVSWSVGKKSVAYDTALAHINRTAKVSDATLRVLSLFRLVAGSVSTVYMPRG